MSISKEQLDRFKKLWEEDTGERLSSTQAIEEFNKLIQFVKAGIKTIIQKDESENK